MKERQLTDYEVELKAKYPTFFKHLGETGHSMYYGLDCGPGWRGIIEGVARQMEVYGDVSAKQIKNKYGDLIIHVTTKQPMGAWFYALTTAQYISRHVCESCGVPYNRRDWNDTCSDDCSFVRAPLHLYLRDQK